MTIQDFFSVHMGMKITELRREGCTQMFTLLFLIPAAWKQLAKLLWPHLLLMTVHEHLNQQQTSTRYLGTRY